MNAPPEGFALSFALAGEASPLNAAMLKFCYDAYGSKVGDGQASSLASLSLEAIGAAPARGTEFGDPIDMLSVVPGDVIQFSWCKFKGLLEEGGGHYIVFAGDASTLGAHTAIVFQVERAGLSMVCLEQNINGATEVRHSTYRLGDMIEGSFQCYRPKKVVPETTIASPARSKGKKFVTLTNLQKTKIMDAFRALDTNQSGFLEFHEFKAVLQQKGLELEQIWKAFNAADVDQDGRVGPEEYTAFVMQAWTAAQAEQSSQEETEEPPLEPKAPASDAIVNVAKAQRVAAQLKERGAEAVQRRASFLKHRASAARGRFMLGLDDYEDESR